MSKGTVLKGTLIFSLGLGFLSTLVALISGGDIVSIVLERFLLTSLLAAALFWVTLSIINSVLMRAALTDYVVRRMGKERPAKGVNLDFTSAPPSDLLNESFEVKKGAEAEKFEKSPT